MFKFFMVVVSIIIIGYVIGWENISNKTIDFLNRNKTTISKGAELVDNTSKTTIKKLKEASEEVGDSINEISDEDPQIKDKKVIKQNKIVVKGKRKMKDSSIKLKEKTNK